MQKKRGHVTLWQTLPLFAGMALASLATAQISFTAQNSGIGADIMPSVNRQTQGIDRSALPPPPKGRSTVEGGTIRSVDPVRDQLVLNIYGAKPMKILFDNRTQIYRNGKKAPLSDLQAQDHASVETVLDGTKIFALSIHMLSQAPEGECQGQVQSYDAGTGQLVLTAALSLQPIVLHVPAGTPVIGVGQVNISSPTAGLQDLVKGTLVSVKFLSSNNGRGVARQISILATPGSAFAFNGKIISLNLASNRLVLLDPMDNQTYSIVFDPSQFPESRNLHIGTHVAVSTKFDGSRYIANAITLE